MKELAAVAPLLTEHALLRRVISLMAKEAKRVESGGPPNPVFVANVVDFIRVFADRYHHVKEEDILFGELRKKGPEADLASFTDELVREHRHQRAVVERLSASNAAFERGDRDSTQTIVEAMKSFVEFYSRHMDREDRELFPRAMRLFTDEEKRAMLRKERSIDRILDPERFAAMVESMEDSWWE